MKKKKHNIIFHKKKLSALIQRIIGGFYCLNCLHSFRRENKLENKLEKVYKHKDFCGIATPSEKGNILKFNQYMKSDKMPYIIYADIESLIKIIDGCTNNPEDSTTTKIWAFDNIENIS